jgi:hypothetical protein
MKKLCCIAREEQCCEAIAKFVLHKEVMLYKEVVLHEEVVLCELLHKRQKGWSFMVDNREKNFAINRRGVLANC